MKSLCGFVLLLALVLPGCASSRPVDVVMRDGQRWVTVPEAGVSFPLLGVFEGAEVEYGNKGVDITIVLPEPTKCLGWITVAGINEGVVKTDTDTFSEEHLEKYAEDMAHKSGPNTTFSRANSNRCLAIKNTVVGHEQPGVGHICIGNRLAITIAHTGDNKCFQTTNADFLRMMEQMRFE